MLIYSQGQTKTSFLDKGVKNNCGKADCKTSKIKIIVQQIWFKANKKSFANRPNQGFPNHQFVPSHMFVFWIHLFCIKANSCHKDKDTSLLHTTAFPNIGFFIRQRFSSSGNQHQSQRKNSSRYSFPWRDQAIVTS